MALIRPLDKVAHPRVLVLGGGIAGIQAALEVAAAGLPVTLAEAGPTIGGLMAQLDKTFPTNDCAMCILSPKMLEISRHPLITIQTSTRVIEVRGRAGDFQVLLSRSPRFVDVSKCSGCGECVRACPQKIPDPYNLGLSRTKAIHVPFPQAIPQAAYVTPEA
ncbi:MAG TPA: FAD-dependent oxidoreductase, partial [Desulfobaccales bacterium]|nr:FAD-dependent oxidoreductase [Desulfobaccales bacterium]